MSYILLNPYLEGKKILSKKANLNLDADEIWSDLSGKIKNYIPEFYFSIQNVEDNKIHHIRVRETLENTKVKYNLKVLNNKKFHLLQKMLQKLEQLSLLMEVNVVGNLMLMCTLYRFLLELEMHHSANDKNIFGRQQVRQQLSHLHERIELLKILVLVELVR